MKHIKHLLCGFVVGIVQYFAMTGFSYLSVASKLSVSFSSALLILFHIAIVCVAGWNIFYKVSSYAAVALRIIASIGAYILVWSVCVHFEVIVSLEKWLGLGSGGQNAQGMIELSFHVWLLLISVIMIAFKCLALRKNNQS